MSPRLRRSFQISRIALLVSLSALAFMALFVVSWAIYMPVAALVFAPFSLAAAFISSQPPSPLVNSVAAVALSGGLAAATAAAVFRVLLARARARQRARIAA
jgi:hypothetical protein